MSARTSFLIIHFFHIQPYFSLAERCRLFKIIRANCFILIVQVNVSMQKKLNIEYYIAKIIRKNKNSYNKYLYDSFSFPSCFESVAWRTRRKYFSHLEMSPTCSLTWTASFRLDIDFLLCMQLRDPIPKINNKSRFELFYYETKIISQRILHK